MGPHGLYQHADETTPILSEGYCTDDNARAVQLLVHLKTLLPPKQQEETERLLAICWQYLLDAETNPGTYINFRSANGQWLPRQPESQDMYARLVRSLTEVLVNDTNQHRRLKAKRMLTALKPKIENFKAPRAWAETLIALANLSQTDTAPLPTKTLISQGYEHLATQWQKNSSLKWPWFESTMTYSNTLFTHALLSIAPSMANSNLPTILKHSTHFLIQSTIVNNVFMPIGSKGWYPRHGTISRENQQPIEAGQMFDFLLTYNEVFPEELAPATIAAPYLWFFGLNSSHTALADPVIGASFDGLFSSGPNRHKGAESMLAYLHCEARFAEAPPSIRRYISQQLALLATA